MAEPGTRVVGKRLKWAEHDGGKRTRQPGEVAVVSFATFEEVERATREEEYDWYTVRETKVL